MPTEKHREHGRISRSLSHRSENLGLLYQGLLTGIVRMQAQRQPVMDVATFRSRTVAALEEVERNAIASGYSGADIQETHFAVVVFLDSVVLNSQGPIRAEWERRTLQEELFGTTEGGVLFFEKLDRLRSRRDSADLADMLEVYLLCLLLGFEGRYSGGLRGEIYSITDKLRARIRDIRGTTDRISPNGIPVAIAPQAPLPAAKPVPYLAISIAAIVFTVLLWLAAEAHLTSVTDQIRSMLS